MSIFGIGRNFYFSTNLLDLFTTYDYFIIVKEIKIPRRGVCMNKFKVSGGRPHYLGHRVRLREKFSNYGTESLHDYELLELLLTYAIPRKDVKEEAKRLLAKFKSISGVLGADVKELCGVEGISANSAVLIALCRELAVKSLEEKIFNKDVLSSPQSVYDFSKAKL